MGYIRITGGMSRGRKIVVPAGHTVRPMQDFLREALFDIIGDRIRGAVVMDGFAGTGSVGLEALSRGAEKCYFVEKHPRVIAVLQNNISRCGIEPQAIIIRGDCLRVDISQKVSEAIHFAFFDPPFNTDHSRVIRELSGCRYRLGEAIMIYRFPSRTDPFKQAPHLEIFDRRRYGENILAFFTIRNPGFECERKPEDTA